MSRSNLEARLDELAIPYAIDARLCSPLLVSTAGLVIAPNGEQTPQTLACLAEEDVQYQALGSGSNTLLTGTEEAPLETVVISTKNMRGVAKNDQDHITVGAGTPIAATSKYAARQSLSGLEFARDIPGTTAGAVATDAWHPIHAYEARFVEAGIDYTTLPKYISSVLLQATLAGPNGDMVVMTPDELDMANRQSRLVAPDNDLLLTEATFGLEPSTYDFIFGARAVICAGRKAMRSRNQAQNPYSVGRTLGYSFVLNHADYEGKSAANLIAETGSLPDEMIVEGMHHSKKTPNIISNTGDGTADGYLRIADQLQEAVEQEHGIEMPLEVKVIR